MSKSKNNIRTSSNWFSTDLPLTSKRVRVLLSHAEDAENLAESIRAERKGEEHPFVISEEAAKELV